MNTSGRRWRRFRAGTGTVSTISAPLSAPICHMPSSVEDGTERWRPPVVSMLVRPPALRKHTAPSRECPLGPAAHRRSATASCPSEERMVSRAIRGIARSVLGANHAPVPPAVLVLLDGNGGPCQPSRTGACPSLALGADHLMLLIAFAHAVDEIVEDPTLALGLSDDNLGWVQFQ